LTHLTGRRGDDLVRQRAVMTLAPTTSTPLPRTANPTIHPVLAGCFSLPSFFARFELAIMFGASECCGNSN
jgi:hypothetical protein